MDVLDVKKLKKLADACRKAGIKTFKGYGFEFSLSDEALEPKTSNKKVQTPQVSDTTPYQSEALSEETMLFWSVGGSEESLTE